MLIGTHRSRSSDSLITDSAAGATAFSCGIKTYNGAIGVDSSGKDCDTIFEAAKRDGFLTGVVVTSRLTDATPAAFVSHNLSRGMEADMAIQEVYGTRFTDGVRGLDLAIGGGGCYFLPQNNEKSCRGDDRDLVGEARENGWNVETWFEDQDLNQNENKKKDSDSSEMPSLPYLNLLAQHNTPYELDRISKDLPSALKVPSLSQLSSKALDLLSNSESNEKGFILMIEGSQIDLCAHENDAACHVNEALAYNKAIKVVQDWVKEKNEKGERSLIISTSDHETGGVTLGKQMTPQYPNYAYYPEVMLKTKHTSKFLSGKLLNFALDPEERKPSSDEVKKFIKDEILGEEGLGLDHIKDVEVEKVKECIKFMEDDDDQVQFSTSNQDQFHQVSTLAEPPINTADVCRKFIASIISDRAEIGFSTSGHTGVDINVYGEGWNIENLKGNMENTRIATFIAETLGLKLRKVSDL